MKKLLSLFALMMCFVASSWADEVTFDFANNPQNWPVSTSTWEEEEVAKGKVTELTVGNVKLTSIQNNEYNCNFIYKNGDADPAFRVFRTNAFKLTAPEGKAIVKVVGTMAAATFDLEADNGAVADGQWTGNATEVTFTAAAHRLISKIEVFLADENTETVKPANAVEVANIAAFNALEDGKNAKLTLTDAVVNAINGGSAYVQDASGATVIKGISLTAGTKLNGFIVGTKSTEELTNFATMELGAYEYTLTSTDATTFEATATTLAGTVMTMTEAGAQANYGKLITLENLTTSGSNKNNKILKDANGNTFRARNDLNVLGDTYEWPEKVSKITGVVIFYSTGWAILPISEEAIVAYQQPTEIVFDFENNNLSLPYGQNGTFDQQKAGDLTGKSISKDGVVLNFVSAPTLPTRYYLNGARGLQLQSLAGGQMRVTAPAGYAVTQIVSTGNKSVNATTGAVTYQNSWTANKGGGTLTAANKETQTWTGNAESVRLNAATCYVNAITVTLAPVNSETALRANEEADNYTEVDGLAAFSNAANNALVKLKLTNAIITSGMVNEQGYYIQDATGGAHIYYTGLEFNVNDVLNGTIYVKKNNQSVGARIAQTEDTNSDGLKITANGSYEPIASTSIETINVTANKCRVVKLTGVSVKGTGELVATMTDSNGKTLEINNGKTNNAPYVYQESLATMDLTNATVVGILYGSNATTNKLYPLSIDGTSTGIANVDANDNFDANAPMYNLAGQKVNKSYKGVVIVNGRKFVNK